MTDMLEMATMAEWLSAEVGGAGTDVAVLGGHYAIFTAGAAATDLLDSDATPDGAREMLDFTRQTWRWVCQAARTTRGLRPVVMADDIQFVRPVTSDRSVAERLAASLTRDYYTAVPTLPTFHLRELTASGISHDRVLCDSEQRWVLSERDLRRAAVRRVRDHVTAGGGGRAALTSSDNGNTISVTLPELGDYCMVHSGHATCAAGYAEMVAWLHDRGIRKLIAFVPMRCLSQVSLGTKLAISLFSLPGLSVTNVAVPNAGVSQTAVVDHHGTRLVPSTY